MFEKTADVVAGDIGKPGVTGLVIKQWLAVLPQRLMGVHTGAAIASQWLGHKGCGLPVSLSGVANDVLKRLHIVARMQQVRVFVVNFLDASAGYFGVETVKLKADFLQVVHNVIAHRNGLVIRSDREITIINTNLVAAVRAAIHHGFLARTPPTLIRIYVVERMVNAGGIAHRIKDVELRLGTDGTRICNAGFLQILLRILRDGARVAAVGGLGKWIANKELHVQSLVITERIDIRGFWIRDQNHVRFIYRGESRDGGAIESEAFAGSFFREKAGRHSQRVLSAENIAEADI